MEEQKTDKRNVHPRKWTFESCFNIAQKYKVQRDFRAANKGAFDAAIRNGWMRSFAWLQDGRGCATPHPTKWSYDACYQEAQKYETRSDFMRGNESAYHKAREKGWIDDYTWFIDGNKRNAKRKTKWTYEACLEVAKRCRQISDLMEESIGAYNAAKKNQWTKDYTWFANFNNGCKRYKCKWTEQICREVALKYTIKRDFKESEPSAFAASQYHGWFKDYTWLGDGRKSGITRSTGYKSLNNNHSHPKHTNEQIIDAAKKYTKKVDFLHNDNALYHAALHRGLMEQFTWLQSSAHLFDSINFVYRYYFKDQNAVYVGRTINPEDRDFEHRRERGKESSAVLKFAQAQGIDIPPMEILARGLSGLDSQRVEDEYVQKYRAEGMLVLNKGATGVGRGSMGMKKKYNKTRFMKEARKHSSLRSLIKDNPNLYDVGRKNGWLDECPWLTREIRKSCLFTKDYCMAIARTCKSRKELFKKDSTVYDKMVANGWFDECDWLPSAHEGYHELTHDYCLEVARQYTTVQALAKDHSSIVRKLYKKGWIRECGWMAIRWKNRINKFDLNDNLLETYDSFKDAAKSLSDLTNSPNARILISEVCRHKRESAYGFIWRFADDVNPEPPSPALLEGNKSADRAT